MAKRNETLEIEKALADMCEEKRLYGCEEITIGFVNAGYGNEIVDFMTMDSKGILRCYEIKVTLQDLKSKAKKSWHGHFNYLVVSSDLYRKVSDWKEYLPDGVGLIRAYPQKHGSSWGLECVHNPKKQQITDDMNTMLKESIVRSMYYKMLKFKDSQSIEKMKKLQQEQRYWEKQYREEQKDFREISRKVRKFERIKSKNDGRRISIEDCIAVECKKAGISYDDLF